MIEIIECKECGNSELPLDSKSITVILTSSSWCRHCNQTLNNNTELFFCSEACFCKFMKKVLDGTTSLQ